jgi:hypothetical protein
MDKDAPKNEERMRFRAEAAELPGISEAEPSAKPKRADDPPSNTNCSTDTPPNPDT